MHAAKLRPLLLPLLIASPLAVSAENPTAHQHGHAELQLALSGQTVELYALSPAYNLLGFEHEPRTSEEHQVVDTTIAWLHETPLINTLGLNCTIQASEVRYTFAGDQNHHGSEHESENKGKHESHTDIEISQTLSCPDLDAASLLTSPMGSRFSALEHLEIAWTGPDGQGSLRLERGETSFQLGR
ncbi:DUF2796 domain-containing protein [Marinobacter alexandrii]|uniref:ZrgA family zinc uptake protein n=1 Tax=Marinobacter alexandrii TaxID=2570351 RepID=UPI001FFFF642|nr:DUF2796 domain-containing protein [Marinobacter alexandrii]MCK2150746.1 DUF2796 domain-containing protein [Marinobacter alexandrii]